MRSGQPSRTALGAAVHRAAHQVLEGGRVFADPLAMRILGPEADALIEDAQRDPRRERMRHFVAARSRFAEDAIGVAVEGGVRQLVVLGAGLDTYAFRSPYADRLQMFEVDHPSTQTWKREKLASASITIPAMLTFVPVELERERLDDALRAAGFDLTLPTFFSWLGVTPYLTESAVLDTFGFIARHPGGSHVVFDYANPTASITDRDRRGAQEALAASVSEQGEPFRSYFDTEALHRALRALGFVSIEDLGPGAIARRYFGRPTVTAPAVTDPDRGGHVGHATTLQLSHA